MALVLLSLAAACGGGGGEGSGPRDGAIETFDSSVDAGFGPAARLHLALVINPESTREEALEHLQSDDPAIRIAAVYALAVTVQPGDDAALAPMLASTDPRERVLAAAGMLALGDRRAVPVLIATLGEDTALPFGSPPARVWQKARYALLTSTGQDFGLGAATTAEEAAATVPQWQAWWTDAEASFQVVPPPDGL